MKKLIARQRRFWHCLFGMFSGHCMTNLYRCKQAPQDSPFEEVMAAYREVLVEMGCSCGRVFWRAE